MKSLLFPIAWIYRLGGWFRNLFFELRLLPTSSAPQPVISVGNISFGGSEKTPLVMKLTGWLLDRGFRPAVVSRGYRGRWEARGGIHSDGRERQGTWRDAGDEPFMLADNHPAAGVFVGKDRLSSCQAAAEKGFSPVVLDDGFQHRRLARDIDIVLYDPLEHVWLREPVTALKRADIILVKSPITPGDKGSLEARFPRARVFQYSVISLGLYSLTSRSFCAPGILRGKKLLAFCGIAHPQRFLELLGKEEMAPVKFHAFPDHHDYPSSSVDTLLRLYRSLRAEAMVTTEKDAVKLVAIPELLEMPLYYVKIDLDIEAGFFSEILTRLPEGPQEA